MKDVSTRIIVFIAMALLLNNRTASAQVSGIKIIPGDYATISAAITDIQASGVSGHVILELQQSYYWHNEMYPITIPESFPTSADETVTIRPAAGATGVYVGTGFLGGGPMPTGDIPIFKIYGSWFNIDGRPGGTGTARELYVWSQAPEGSAIQFTNNANNNTISYCNLLGINDPLYYGSFGNRRGIVTFNPEGPFPVGVLGGTHDNTIESCLFDGAVIWRPEYAIYAIGNNSAPNIGNRILNNEIRNFRSRGIFVNDDGPGSGWTISGNSFYSNETEYTYPYAAIELAFLQNAAGTNVVSGNYFGGNGPLATGKWLGGLNTAITISLKGGVSTSVQNNTIKNMELVEGPAPNPWFPILHGIRLTNTAPNIINCDGNLIGGDVGDFGISIQAFGVGKSAYFTGIYYYNCSAGSVTQNTVQNVQENSGSNSNFTGIHADVAGNVNVSQNTIQQLDIQSAGNINVRPLIIGSGSDHHPPVASCDLSPLQLVFDHNLVNSITATAGDGDALFTGAGISARIAGNTGNVIGSASQANNIVINGKNVLANGILLTEILDDVSISGDVVANITANGTTSSSLAGIHFNGTGVVKIRENQLHHLNATSVKGISIEPVDGNSTATLEKNTITGVNINAGNGIEVSVPAATSLNFIAKENTITTWQNGFLVNTATGSTLTQTVQSNFVSGNQTGFNNQSAASQNATCNWWGSASGPSGAGPGTGDPVGSNVVFSPWATIAAFVAVNAGADQVIYLGYGASSKTITPAYTVCGPATYSWSNGATTGSITVSPTVTTTYTVTVTDANGHSASDNVTINVKDVRCGINKVKVCHKDIKNKKQTLCVSSGDVASHLAHGDVLGDCPAAKGFEQTITVIEDISADREMLLNPNPARDMLNLQWKSNVQGTVGVKVQDIFGSVLVLQQIPQGAGINNYRLPIGALQNGTYVLSMETNSGVNIKRFRVQR